MYKKRKKKKRKGEWKEGSYGTKRNANIYIRMVAKLGASRLKYENLVFLHNMNSKSYTYTIT